MTAGRIFRKERRPQDAPTLRRGIERMMANRSALSHQAGMSVMCPICSITFYRAPSHVARVAVSYCSRACQAEGQKVRIETHCVSCGKEMEQTPSGAARITVCSYECSTIRRQGGNLRPSKKTTTAAWKRAIKEVSKRGECAQCGVKNGPWRVVGMEPEYVGATQVLDTSLARLLCLHCHMKNVGPIGGAANAERIKRATVQQLPIP